MSERKPKVIVGLSGGVDSSVALIRLKEQGYDVEAMYMRNWDSAVNNDVMGNPDLMDDVCPQERDYQDAKKVAEQLGIKLHRVDFIEEYWNSVFAYFLSEYRKNRTPNPDILCNKEIKFKTFLDKAVELGVYKIVPVAMKRCVVRLDDKKAAKKVERWGEIARSAAKQSGRG